MSDLPQPYADQAARLEAVIQAMGMKQKDFAKQARIQPTQLSNWMAGTHRIGLDGALKLRETYGLSLDFLYFGIVDRLPHKIAVALTERPLERSAR